MNNNLTDQELVRRQKMNELKSKESILSAAL